MQLFQLLPQSIHKCYEKKEITLKMCQFRRVTSVPFSFFLGTVSLFSTKLSGNIYCYSNCNRDIHPDFVKNLDLLDQNYFQTHTFENGHLYQKAIAT